MNPRTAKNLVITGTAVAGILASVVALAEGGRPDMRVGVGMVVAGGVMYALTDAAPDVAGGLALLMLTGSLLTHGVQVSRILGAATKG